MRRNILILLTIAIFFMLGNSSCESATDIENIRTKNAVASLQQNQPTPADIEFSISRHLLIKRAYIQNGLPEKAASLPCPVNLPIGYLILYAPGGAVQEKVLVEGFPVATTTYLTPDSEEYNSSYSEWVADVDGTFGENLPGLFFFEAATGLYREHYGAASYSQAPIEVQGPVIKIQGVGNGE